MNKITSVLLTAVALSFAASASADHQKNLPPKARAVFGDHRTAPSAGVQQHTFLGAGTKAQAARNARIAVQEADMSYANRPSYTGKWPFETRPASQFQIAPLKGSGKGCSPNCAKPCCAKK